MFHAVKGADAEFVSLQRDADLEFKPGWVKDSKLDTWEDTRAAIAGCDLVISSCTSVAHLAGAMGIETWLISPVLPYFLWAAEGDKTPYYDSMTIYHQEVFGDWQSPFNKIKGDLL
jgi:hypothetical protein